MISKSQGGTPLPFGFYLSWISELPLKKTMKNKLAIVLRSRRTLTDSLARQEEHNSWWRINAYGEKLGGSGKPQRHRAQHSTRNRPKDAVRQDGKTAPRSIMATSMPRIKTETRFTTVVITSTRNDAARDYEERDLDRIS